MIYSNKEYSVLAICARLLTATTSDSDAIWFGSAHCQHDTTALENGAQLREIQYAIASLLPGGCGRTVIGLDANMLGLLLVHDAAAAGLVEHCGVSHPSTFPAVSPLYRPDGLLTVAGGAVTVDVSDKDMALSALGSLDPATGEQSSDHMPVVGTLRQLA